MPFILNINVITGLHIGPLKSTKDPESLGYLCLNSVARMIHRSVDKMKRREQRDEENCRQRMSSMLPSDRNEIMNIIYSCRLSKNMTTTRKFLI